MTALMAAIGMGGVRVPPWVAIPRAQRESLALESVQLAADLGVDVNATITDGRTALDAAKAARLESVVKFLIEKGAGSGKPAPAQPRR